MASQPNIPAQFFCFWSFSEHKARTCIKLWHIGSNESQAWRLWAFQQRWKSHQCKTSLKWTDSFLRNNSFQVAIISLCLNFRSRLNKSWGRQVAKVQGCCLINISAPAFLHLWDRRWRNPTVFLLLSAAQKRSRSSRSVAHCIFPGRCVTLSPPPTSTGLPPPAGSVLTAPPLPVAGWSRSTPCPRAGRWSTPQRESDILWTTTRAPPPLKTPGPGLSQGKYSLNPYSKFIFPPL